jgi:hypothetical protein
MFLFPSREVQFPHLRIDRYSVTSPETPDYNCIAWAVHDTERWWWPSPYSYWPDQAPEEATLEAFVRAFQILGFEPCDDDALEEGIEKVAIYTDSQGVPTHGARQLPNGRWTSKLGELQDIEHTSPHDLEGDVYGMVGAILSRPR